MIKTKQLPSQEYLSECLTYDPETGLLYWKIRPLEHFISVPVGKTWNTKHSFNLAFNNIIGGYKTGYLNHKEFKGHRIIWKLITGVEPVYVDHIDGDLFNNKIENLRSVTHLENMKNQSKAVNNTSGCTGVYWHKTFEKWVARINYEGRSIHLGYFINLEDAIKCRKESEMKYEYHENHGRNLQTVTI